MYESRDSCHQFSHLWNEKTDNINTRSIKHGISDIYDSGASNG